VYCYEDKKLDNDVPAVALCAGCGAGVCGAHVQECATTEVTSNAVGAPTIRTGKRVLHCQACHRSAPCGR
jgi:hypothetical protein